MRTMNTDCETEQVRLRPGDPEFDQWFAAELVAAESVMARRAAKVMQLSPDHDDVREMVAHVRELVWFREWSKYDPDRGPVWAWVATITPRRAVDKMRHENGREKVKLTAVEDETLDFLATEQGEVIESIEGTIETAEEAMADYEAQVAPILELVSKAMDPIRYRRVLDFHEHGSTAVTAQIHGVSTDTVRQDRREFSLLVSVILKADEARAAGDPKTLATLLGCLPAEGESGSWAREASAAIIYAGGSWTDVKPDHVQKAIPGMSKTTARQYWAKTERLLRVAMTRLNQKDAQ